VKLDGFVEIGARSIKFFVSLRISVRSGDLAQVKPGSHYLIETAAGRLESGLHPAEDIDGLLVCTRRGRVGLNPGAVSPARVSIFDPHSLRTILHADILATNGPCFKGQGSAATGSLQHNIGRRKLRSVVVRQEALTLSPIGHVTKENRLGNYTHLGLLNSQDLLLHLQYLSQLFLKRATPTRDQHHGNPEVIPEINP
jgi:hypothetical protein